MKSVFRRLAERSIPPFAWVTAAGGAVIASSGLLDAITSTGDPLGSGWTWFWVIVTIVLAGTPIALGIRFVHWVGLAGVSTFFAVTALQMAVSTAPVASVNNLVLYPMMACYLGWFYRRWVARMVTGLAFGLSGVAVLLNPFDDVFITWINLGLASMFCLEAAGYLRSRLDREITTDPLTGVSNRAGLDARIETELGRAVRTAQAVTIAIIDLDDFKRINDELGHAAGDRLLVEFAALLRTNTRPYDSVARIGGDEFLLILPALTEAEAAELLERLRTESGQSWSFGLAEALPHDTAQSIRERADLQLYSQKGHRRRGSGRP